MLTAGGDDVTVDSILVYIKNNLLCTYNIFKLGAFTPILKFTSTPIKVSNTTQSSQ